MYFDDDPVSHSEKETMADDDDDSNHDIDSEERLDESDDDGYNGYNGYDEYGGRDGGYYYSD
jgi:hypothetical protein